MPNQESVYVDKAKREYGLGFYKKEDARDHLMAVVNPTAMALSSVALPIRFSRDQRWIGDQGNEPQCVGFSTAGFMRCEPEKHLHWLPPTLYKEAQQRDPWPGDDYAGTTVRAAFSFLKERGEITSYQRILNVEQLKKWLFLYGPVVFGTDWYMDMFTPNGRGFISVTGENVGGHAYLVYGYDDANKAIRIANSWGKGWGKGGRALLHYDDTQKLLDAAGEAWGGMKANLPRHKIE